MTFDFRGHGRSGGLSTMGDREIQDLNVAVAYARELGYQRIAAVGFSMGASVVLRHASRSAASTPLCRSAAPGRWHTAAPSGCAAGTARSSGGRDGT